MDSRRDGSGDHLSENHSTITPLLTSSISTSLKVRRRGLLGHKDICINRRIGTSPSNRDGMGTGMGTAMGIFNNSTHQRTFLLTGKGRTQLFRLFL